MLSKQSVTNGVTWRCGLTPDGSFTVNAFRKRWDYHPLYNDNFHWLKEIPMKVSCFIWREKLGKIPAALELSKRGVNLDILTCRMYDETKECVNHVIVKCSYATMIMEGIMRWCKVNVNMEDFHTVINVLDFAARWVSCLIRRKIFLPICYGTL